MNNNYNALVAVRMKEMSHAGISMGKRAEGDRNTSPQVFVNLKNTIDENIFQD